MPPSFFLLFERATGQFHFKQVDGGQEAHIITRCLDVKSACNSGLSPLQKHCQKRPVKRQESVKSGTVSVVQGFPRDHAPL